MNPSVGVTARRDAYAKCRAEARAVLEDEHDPIACMASLASMLFRAVPRVSFVGFYRVVERELLVVGPYQGPLACLRIPFSRGVCGAAAREGRVLIVPDVHAFPGHIACDGGARSELVLPVRNGRGDLMGVLDLDSHEPAAFDELDAEELSTLLSETFERF